MCPRFCAHRSPLHRRHCYRFWQLSMVDPRHGGACGIRHDVHSCRSSRETRGSTSATAARSDSNGACAGAIDGRRSADNRGCAAAARSRPCQPGRDPAVCSSASTIVPSDLLAAPARYRKVFVEPGHRRLAALSQNARPQQTPKPLNIETWHGHLSPCWATLCPHTCRHCAWHRPAVKSSRQPALGARR